MNTRESTNGFPAARLTHGMAALAHDAMTIAQLQAKLVAIDLKDGSQLVRRSAWFALLGGTLFLACLPVGLIGVAELLVAVAGWKAWAAYLVTAAAGLLGSGVLLWLCWRSVQRSSGVMSRSNAELAANLEWFKGALRREQSTE